MRIRYIFLLLLMIELLPASMTMAQQSGYILTQNTIKEFSFDLSVELPDSETRKHDAGSFNRLSLPGYTTTMTPGDPELPVFARLVEIPVGAMPVIQITCSDSLEIPLQNRIYPHQPSLSKNDDPQDVPFYYNEDAYEGKGYLHPEIASYEILGTLRDSRIMRVSVCPFDYNPAKGSLTVYTQLSVTVTYENGNLQQTQQQKLKYGHLQYKNSGYESLPTDPVPSSTPITYAIVADRMFESQLAPFIHWKEQKGFKVIIGYTDEIGTTTSAIKTWLSGLYNTPAQGYSAPLFLLLAGDISQIPAWSGSAGNHKSDFYYAEYTGDMLPDLYVGRLSANNAAEMQPQIDKTLEYERYLFPDPTFLDEVVMAAGADSYHAPTYGNGQIGYGTEYYFNSDHSITSHTYLQPEPSGANYSGNIRQNVSDGVAYANYTAHCSASGWSNPSFYSSHVPALQNQSKYCLMVGNCCQSATFSTTCFGEIVLRAENKGAIGYIGGTNYTYWDEDFWWGVGVEPISATPSYHSNNLGAYDRRFHDMPGITRTDWYVTQGEMPVAGNLAVTQAGSYRTNYYWEIYTLLGDPSLSVWLSQPPPMPLTYADLSIGDEALAVTAASDVLVAVMVNDSVCDVKVMGPDATASLTFPALQGGDTLVITATHFAFQPVIDTVIIENTVNQVVTLTQGWNGVSTWLDLSDSLTTNIFSAIADTLIIMKNINNVYWPPYANNIPVWQNNSGYIVKVTDGCQIVLSGLPGTGNSIALTEGWNLIAVRSDVPVDVTQLFAPVIDDLIIVKNAIGSGVYWPSTGVNSLGNIIPGKSYMVKMEAPGIITF